MSRRPAGERPDVRQPGDGRREAVGVDRTPRRSTRSRTQPSGPRARSRGAVVVPTGNQPAAGGADASEPRSGIDARTRRRGQRRRHHTDPLTDAGPVHRVLEGTLIDAVLTNRLDGSGTAPVNCLVTESGLLAQRAARS